MGQVDKNVVKGRQPSSPRKEKAARFGDAKFIQYELDAEQQKACKAWEADEALVFSMVEEMISDGYKFTIKYDTYGDCYGCFVFAADDHATNGGTILTGRGNSAWKSVKQALWKHHVALSGDWSAYAERQGRALLDD